MALRIRSATEFNNLSRDGSREPIQVANTFQTADATASPQVSPLAYSNSPIAIVVPVGAIQISMLPTSDMEISELSAMTNYDLIKANTKELISCAQMSTIYIQRLSGDGSLYFKFYFV